VGSLWDTPTKRGRGFRFHFSDDLKAEITDRSNRVADVLDSEN
jgi:hypothetical protein